MVKVSVLALLWQAQVQEARTVEEALEALRELWRRDNTVREFLAKAAKEGYVLVDTKDVPAPFVAAIKVALARLRKYHLGEEKPSTLVVTGGKGKEERKVMTWEAPEGVQYRVEPYDLTPREEKYWSYRDKRAEDAAKWVEQFLSMTEYEEGPSPLEEAMGNEENPHFRRDDLISEDLEAELRLLGWDGTLRNLQALVDTLPTREEEFKRRVRSITALVDRRGGKAEVVAVRTPIGWEVKEKASKPILNAVIAIGVLERALEKEDWRTKEVRRWVQHVEPFVPGLERALDAIATLRRAKRLLDQLGRRRVVVYRDPSTGEPVYRTPVIG
jgi:hypothetical protein